MTRYDDDWLARQKFTDLSKLIDREERRILRFTWILIGFVAALCAALWWLW